jgi:hypothetical protein
MANRESGNMATTQVFRAARPLSVIATLSPEQCRFVNLIARGFFKVAFFSCQCWFSAIVTFASHVLVFHLFQQFQRGKEFDAVHRRVAAIENSIHVAESTSLSLKLDESVYLL